MDEVVVSVRGEATRSVAPDEAVLHVWIRLVAATKADALRETAARQEAVRAALAALGGEPRTPDSQRRPLTWSSRSVTTQQEHDFDPRTGKHGPTGRIEATVDVAIVVRDFGLLDRVDAALATLEAVDIRAVSWHVDADNPAWPHVRAAAIDAAIAKGRDYAAALGGSLVRIEHIADAGLLDGGDGPAPVERAYALAAHSGGPDVPSLDPIPQSLTATIEARLTAAAPGLDAEA